MLSCLPAGKYDMIVIMSETFVSLLSRLPHRQQHFGAGALVFERDDPAQVFHCVRQGLVHLVRRQVDGATFILQRAGPGDVLGEASLTTQAYHCAAVAVTDSVLCVFSQSVVRAEIGRNGAMAQAFLAHLGREVRRARLRAEIASLRKVSDRLDAWLVWHDGVLPEKGQWHHLAQELAVSPPALYRELARRR